jgi:phosphoserine aminotransferase
MIMTSTTSHRVFNFSAGPAVLPLTVLQEAQRDLICLPGAGASVLEISHRSPEFREIHQTAQQRLRDLLQVPDSHQILFLQGGARLQFSMVPMNLLPGSRAPAQYLLTGSWGKHALAEARRAGDVHVCWDGQESGYDRLPSAGELAVEPDSAYLHFTSNETIQGVQFPAEPEVGDLPLVCDASSDFLSRPVPIERYGIFYACAQKNAGPAGVTIVIIRRDLLTRSDADLPGYLNYRVHAENDSLWNTPPTFGVYMVGLVARWLQEEIGGLQAMQERNVAKARLLYDVIDASDGFYAGHAQPACRSSMNVTFRLASAELEQRFLAEAAQRELCSLKGHRSVGGIRASIYNAMPREGVEALRDFMRDFQDQHHAQHRRA